MTRTKVLIILSAAMAILVLTVACGRGTTGNGDEIATADGGGTSGLLGGQPSGDSVGLTGFEGLGVSFITSSQVNSQQGIFVTGTGTVTADPDLAILNLGVQVTADTVREALERANVSLNAMLGVLDGHGIEEKDTQTRFFNIFPQYDFRPDRERVLIGYQVTNQLSVKIRDLDNIGPIIDDVVEVGGNPVQINGITFTIEDTSELSMQAREAAVKAAMAQAEQFARLTGVVLGKLVQISQVGGAGPVVRAEGAQASFDLAIAPTPVRIGELDVSVTVQAVFAIE